MSLKMCKKECMTSNRKCQDSRYKQEAKKTDFHWRKGACQTPHCCYKSTPVLTSCVDNIPTVCAPRPLFSLLRLLVGLQPKHGPLFIGSLHISMAVASPPESAAVLASLRNKDNMFSSLSWKSRAVLVTSPSLDGNWRCNRSPPPLFTQVHCLFHTFNLQITPIITAALLI